VRRDGDDAYLVVAADKGTATFSDIANAISIEYGHWLGDAFASGGSAGYDHKGMGITARGAWECVKRHFRELGVDIQAQGLHLRRHRRHVRRRVRQRHAAVEGTSGWVAAFDHRNIFIDPGIPTRPPGSANASACSSYRARAGTTTRAG
jgi:glutamate dehydrogenase